MTARIHGSRATRKAVRTLVAFGFPMGLSISSALVSVGCQKPPEARDLTSLRRSGDATFICVGPDGQGAPLADCPQGPRADDRGLTVGHDGYELHSLVTQTLSAEVAVIRVSGLGDDGDSTGKVLDVDPTNPGVTPLRIGEQPGDIVTTPGGRASFVGVAQVGLEGIYGLPTRCIFEPEEGEPRRDRTTWPACSLESAPGDMLLLVDEEEARTTCGATPPADLPSADAGSLCGVDLTEEVTEPGRRKLLVSLPDEGKLVVLDAQDILDRAPGSFEPCHVEKEYELSGAVPEEILQPLPGDLAEDGGESWVIYDGLGGEYTSRPAGMDERDGLLLISDGSAPLIHRYDARDVCNLQPLEPLLATSYLEPRRVVTTSRVAISPKSPTGTQIVYAVDEMGDGLSSVMAFDLSEGSQSRVPLMRPGASLLPYQAPDRIEFHSSVKDVSFALLDRAQIDPTTGVAVTGIECNPDPSAPSSDLGINYRPSSDTIGAGPSVLRGLFGYALLSDGAVSVIDIEDFDQACRRPKESNPSSELDFRGCSGDEIDLEAYTIDGDLESTPTVTDEASCRVIVPHQPRSQVFVENDESTGIQAPALRGFGRLSQRGRGLTASRLTPEGRKKPILLGVDFESPGGGTASARVSIGTTLYSTQDQNDSLVIDPNAAERITMVLPFTEPRAYPETDIVSAIYEGQLDRTRPGAIVEPGDAADEVVLLDDNVSFCSIGVQDQELTGEMARRRFELAEGAVERFAARHTDYVQLTNRLFNERDAYWSAEGASCGEDISELAGSGYEVCDSLFGEGDEEDLSTARDLTVVRAMEDRLVLTPRNPGDLSASDHLKVLTCCLPGAQSYRIRGGRQWIVRGSASGFEHAIVTDPASDSGSCVFDTRLLRARLRGRAFEVSSTACDVLDPNDPAACGVGLATEEDIVCRYDARKGPVQPGAPPSDCIFDGLTRRFVIYRGLEPSTRDMAFGFEVVGGFRPFFISLVSDTNVILPVRTVSIPTYNALGVVDAENRGLMMIDLTNAHVAQTFY